MVLKIYKTFVAFSVIATLLAFNFEIITTKSANQYRFEQWLIDVEQRIESLPVPSKSELSIEGRFNNTLYTFNVPLSPDNRDALFRVLELLKEAQVFTHNESDLNDSNVEIIVRGFGSSFSASIPSEIALKDHKIQLLFKLLELKGGKTSASSVALHQRENIAHD